MNGIRLKTFGTSPCNECGREISLNGLAKWSHLRWHERQRGISPVTTLPAVRLIGTGGHLTKKVHGVNALFDSRGSLHGFYTLCSARLEGDGRTEGNYRELPEGTAITCQTCIASTQEVQT